MLFRKAIVALALVFATANLVPATAADMQQYKAPTKVSQVFNWTGFYGGIRGAGEFGDSSFAGGVVATDLGGFSVGGQLGYNWQFSNSMFVGIEAGIDYADINGGVSILNGLARVGHNLDFMYDVNARLGFLVTERTALFGRVGYRWGDATASVSLGGFSDSASATHKGIFWGVGIEHYMTQHVSLFAEFQQWRPEDQNYSFATLGNQNGAIDSINSVKVGLNVKLGNLWN